MNKLRQKQQQQGFTIIELMIATTIFSLVLMICLGGILQITKMYYRGVTQAKTQEVARTVADELAESFRFTNAEITLADIVTSGPDIADASDAEGYFCLGSRRYTYAIDRQRKSSISGVKQIKHVLWVDQLPISSSCTSGVDLTLDNPSADGQEMINENMRLTKLSITEIVGSGGSFGLYKIDVGVAYGDEDLLTVSTTDGSTKNCEGGSFVGTEFCAVSNFTITVDKRL